MKLSSFHAGRIFLTLVMTLLAGLLAVHLWDYYMDAPWTRDGKVRADYVSVAPDVSGFVRKIYVRDNDMVKKGDILFSLDKSRYELALAQQEAAVERATATLEMARKDEVRYQNLDDSAVTQQKREQVVSSRQEAEGALAQVIAERDLARLDLERTDIFATVDGVISNFNLRPGTYLTAGVAVAALVDTSSFYVAGYFEENKLERIAVNDPVDIHLMGSGHVLRGRVQGIAAGIHDSERADNPGTLASVSPTFNWVRLAQRVPVRVQIEDVPPEVRLVSGRTASVFIRKKKDRTTGTEPADPVAPAASAPMVVPGAGPEEGAKPESAADPKAVPGSEPASRPEARAVPSGEPAGASQADPAGLPAPEAGADPDAADARGAGRAPAREENPQPGPGSAPSPSANSAAPAGDNGGALAPHETRAPEPASGTRSAPGQVPHSEPAAPSASEGGVSAAEPEAASAPADTR
ncbi:efflux RND transporter periplasmic adaptor subunit [Phaeovibrio sulfidiphilus]|uniref:Efflux RND transporter periplasmic adaptor subunit n=1 Tax=Phaeovibrio sulfidiphilus TaxID=1220600 RepID=A0A8J6YQW9_9PROT|nr:HlyD family secretion protein [Phaeovibrio sulfidiphilus]MBE1237732.1 efflux RND transporter periplasmic adaptor subunit [Phaeovibrio sulfidiphilus]